MTNEGIYEKLTKSGLNVIYRHSSNSPSMPYVVYREAYSNNIYMDDRLLARDVIQVDLYTVKKDADTEKKLEDALISGGFVWNKTASYDDGQSAYQVIYEFEVIR